MRKENSVKIISNLTCANYFFAVTVPADMGKHSGRFIKWN